EGVVGPDAGPAGCRSQRRPSHRTRSSAGRPNQGTGAASMLSPRAGPPVLIAAKIMSVERLVQKTATGAPLLEYRNRTRWLRRPNDAWGMLEASQSLRMAAGLEARSAYGCLAPGIASVWPDLAHSRCCQAAPAPS